VRLIHTCYRITDPERSVAFYEALGLEKRREVPIRDEAINIFMGVPGEDLPELELTHNYGVDGYELGTAYGHVALTVDDRNPRASQGDGDRAGEAPLSNPRGRLAALLRHGPRRL
jgi:lactoylglutathione lyase